MNSKHRRRRKARERVANRTDRQGCPRPDKAAYTLVDVHEVNLIRSRLGTHENIHRCRCGWIHIGTPTHERWEDCTCEPGFMEAVPPINGCPVHE